MSTPSRHFVPQTHGIRSYVMAVVAVGACVAVRWMLNPLLGDNTPFLLLMPGVVLAALVGGLWPGLLATVLSAALGSYLWVGRPFTLIPATHDELLHMAASLLVGVAVSVMSHAMWRARQAEREANASKDRFIAVLSHELRQPLTGIAAATDTLKQELADRPDLDRTIAIIQRNLALHSLLVDDLLDVNRIASGKLNLAIRPCDLRQVLRAACDACVDEAQAKGVSLECPVGKGERWLQGDPERLQQVFWNLIRNAIKFTPTKGHITVTISSEPDRALVAISDTGIGIPPEKLPQLFTAFSQAHGGLSTRLGGLGLGLAICKGVVQAHGGRISVASEGPGKGSTFTVALPAHAAPGRIRREPETRIECPKTTGNCRILLVEDQDDTRRLLAGLLHRAGYEVLAADSIQTAIDLAKMGVDLLVSDMSLPDGTGAELLARLGPVRPSKSICLTGAATAEDLSASSRAGFTRHLTKPVPFPKLEQTIRQVLGKQPSSSE